MWMSQYSKLPISFTANYEDHTKVFSRGKDSMRVQRFYNSFQ